MAMQQDAAPSSEEQVAGQGGLPPSITHDPTQGTGTPAWQLAQQHSRRLNQEMSERQN